MAFVVTASVSAQQLGATQASGGEQDAESAETDAAARAAAFRAELGQYLYDLEQLPVTLLESVYDSPLSVLEAQRDLPNMTDDELLELEGQLSQIPYPRSLPRLLAASVPTQQYFTPLELAASLDIGGIGFGTEELRGEILDFLADLERLPQACPSARSLRSTALGFQRIREQVLTMNSAELIEVQQGIATNSDEWTAKIRSLSVGVRERGGTVDKANCNASTSNCGSSFPNNVICEIGNVVNEIATIPCYVADFAQEAVDLILDGLISFFELLASASRVRSRSSTSSSRRSFRPFPAPTGTARSSLPTCLRRSGSASDWRQRRSPTPGLTSRSSVGSTPWRRFPSDLTRAEADQSVQLPAARGDGQCRGVGQL